MIGKSEVIGSSVGLVAKSALLVRNSGSVLIACDVWLVMVEIEEVPVQILYGKLP